MSPRRLIGWRVKWEVWNDYDRVWEGRRTTWLGDEDAKVCAKVEQAVLKRRDYPIGGIRNVRLFCVHKKLRTEPKRCP